MPTTTRRIRRRALAALRRFSMLAAACAGAHVTGATRLGAQGVPEPSRFLGIQVGADRTLADWPQITRYFAALAAASPAVTVDTLGPSTNGQPMIVATISTPANVARLAAIRAAQARLADPRTLATDEERRLVASQPAVVLISCNIHATEIASSQMAMELAYRLATVDTLQRALANVVVLLVPSMNPDGEQMVTQWYRGSLGTAWEGGPLPFLYHPYVGHDNNRDWYMVTQKETRLVTDLLYRKWFPEIFYDVHQQGSYGMRLSVPPHVDPIDPNVDPLIVRGINQIGMTMSWALESHGKTGVGDGVTYDLWWHGGARSAPTRHNIIGLLTEAASVRIATPMTLDASQLRGSGRGLPRYTRQVNFPNPWPGGTWHLRDIVDYELIAAEALVTLASDQREQYVRNFVALGRKQVELGRTQAPYGWVISDTQRDPMAASTLLGVLRSGGVELRTLRAATTIGGVVYPRGSTVISAAQPYRAHAKDLLEVQRYPRIEQYPGGPIERPYDVTGWTLPLQMGLDVATLDAPLADSASVPQDASKLDFVVCDRNKPRMLAASTGCAGDRFKAARRRIGLYRSWTANMDEGWSRWVLEQQRVPFATVTDSMVKAGRLASRFDAIVVPDMTLREIRDGMSAKDVPPRYAGGLGAAGIAELRKFAEAGGTLVLVDHASELATGGFELPLVRIAPPRGDEEQQPAADSAAPAARRRPALYAPGSILRVVVDTTHPVALGMPDSSAVYFTNSVTLDVSKIPGARVIARYPSDAGAILLSGFLDGGDAIAGKTAAAEIPLGRGRLVVFGFRPLYRAQSWATFPLLFNALLLPRR